MVQIRYRIRLLVGGNSTNLMNLNNVRFKWATSLWKKMREKLLGK